MFSAGNISLRAVEPKDFLRETDVVAAHLLFQRRPDRLEDDLGVLDLDILHGRPCFGFFCRTYAICLLGCHGRRFSGTTKERSRNR